MEPTRIVVGVDGSATSRRAVRCAVVLGELTGAEVVAVHAIGLLEERHRPEDVSGAWRQQLAQVVEQNWASPLAGASCPTRVEMEDGPADDVLLRVARRERAELLVVGSRGAADADHALGSTSLRLVQAAPLPVLVVPHAAEPDAGGDAGDEWTVRRVVVGVDGSPASDAALARAVDVAARGGAALHVVEVVVGEPDVAAAAARLEDASADVASGASPWTSSCGSATRRRSWRRRPTRPTPAWSSWARGAAAGPTSCWAAWPGRS